MAKPLIGVGETAPDFALTGRNDKTVRLTDVLASHHAILYFVREYT